MEKKIEDEKDDFLINLRKSIKQTPSKNHVS